MKTTPSRIIAGKKTIARMAFVWYIDTRKSGLATLPTSEAVARTD
jgi:hypothetical protein